MAQRVIFIVLLLLLLMMLKNKTTRLFVAVRGVVGWLVGGREGVFASAPKKNCRRRGASVGPRTSAAEVEKGEGRGKKQKVRVQSERGIFHRRSAAPVDKLTL